MACRLWYWSATPKPVSLGHAAFLGIGAYAHVFFSQDMALPWVASVILAAAVTAIAGVLVGLPVLRLSGLYLAIAALAFALIYPGDFQPAAAQGGVTEGTPRNGSQPICRPHRDTLTPAAQGWFDRYKERFKGEPNIGAVYGYVGADVTVLELERAGPNLTVDSFINGLESIRNYHDIFNGPEVKYGPDNSSFLAVVKGGRWTRLTEPLSF